ncbi:MAG: NAD(P)H-dependent oxidoreductase [Crocinitomicaceae bacterium]|nr:NAD(P)H-dependent oxidoreductase [Crocinitomicaceae bacterium]|tara:strand:+ start:6498 stop:7121 length:624 start_codon:yes stop_codon:yes gene_type:complete
MDLTKFYNWRYATKKFDSSKNISKKEMEILKESIRLSPTSYGLQLFKVFIIEDENLKSKLKKVSYNQSQISDSSALFVFCNFTKVKESDINDFIKLKSSIQGIELSTLNKYGDFLKSTLLNKPENETAVWTANQVYIALGNLMTSCAALKIDSCPIEGFQSEKYNTILGLKNMNSAVIAAVGYRSSEDESQNENKVRKKSNSLFYHI